MSLLNSDLKHDGVTYSKYHIINFLMFTIRNITICVGMNRKKRKACPFFPGSGYSYN